jgi:hypothetical protein
MPTLLPVTIAVWPVPWTETDNGFCVVRWRARKPLKEASNEASAWRLDDMAVLRPEDTLSEQLFMMSSSYSKE